MARRLAPKFSEKNFASEKIILIRKNYFTSENFFFLFFLVYCAPSNGRCRNPLDGYDQLYLMVCVNAFFPVYQTNMFATHPLGEGL